MYLCLCLIILSLRSWSPQRKRPSISMEVWMQDVLWPPLAPHRLLRRGERLVLTPCSSSGLCRLPPALQSSLSVNTNSWRGLIITCVYLINTNEAFFLLLFAFLTTLYLLNNFYDSLLTGITKLSPRGKSSVFLKYGWQNMLWFSWMHERVWDFKLGSSCYDV